MKLLLALFLFSLSLPLYAADVNLSWQAGPVLSDSSNAATTFRIYRRTANTSLALLSEVAASTTSAIDTTATAGIKYFYAVSAANSAGESALSAEAATVAAPAGTVAVDIPPGRSGLVSRRATDTSTIISLLVNKSDVVSVNNSTTATTATVTITAPPTTTVLISHRSTDGSTLVPMLVNKSQVLYIKGVNQ